MKRLLFKEGKLPESQLFTCEFCGKKFCHSDRLQLHRIRVHTKEYPYICDQCPFKSRIKRSLDKHLERHKIEKDKAANGEEIKHSRTRSVNCEILTISFSPQRNSLWPMWEGSGRQVAVCWPQADPSSRGVQPREIWMWGLPSWIPKWGRDEGAFQRKGNIYIDDKLW